MALLTYHCAIHLQLEVRQELGHERSARVKVWPAQAP